MKRGKSKSFPRNVVFVDTETMEIGEDVDTKYQTLRLGMYNYTRYQDGFFSNYSHWGSFNKPEQFWNDIISLCEPDRRLIVMAYNAGFDLRILHTFQILTKLGYAIDNFFIDQGCCIVEFKKDNHNIVILDAMNYFKGSLASWGKMLGLPKLDVDFRFSTDAELLVYCKRDVEILKTLWDKWVAFIRENKLGHYSATCASQALSAFKSTYMDNSIVIHNHKVATAIERSAYYGGRTECFHVGKLSDGPYMKVDVNSMYPYIMTKQPVPVKLLRVVDGASVSQLKRALKKYAIVAQVTLKTKHRAYPMRRATGLCFPIGNFQTVLCSPELELAFKNKDIESVGLVALYDQAIIFRRYVEHLYQLRKQYQAEGNTIFSNMIKLLLNSLYGKFGQTNKEKEFLGVDDNSIDGVYTTVDSDTKEVYEQTVICRHNWRATGIIEAYHSFPAISAFITSGARAYLWELITKAGTNNTYYMDTDSLIVNARGYAKLQRELDDNILGKLKLEYATKQLSITAPKHYKTDKETKIKGVRKTATQLSPNTFEFWRWEGMLGAIRKAHTDKVYMYRTIKRLTGNYNKGHVSSSGRTSPFVLALE